MCQRQHVYWQGHQVVDTKSTKEECSVCGSSQWPGKPAGKHAERPRQIYTVAAGILKYAMAVIRHNYLTRQQEYELHTDEPRRWQEDVAHFGQKISSGDWAEDSITVSFEQVCGQSQPKLC